MKSKKSNGASWWDLCWWPASLVSYFLLAITFSRFFSGKLTFPYISLGGGWIDAGNILYTTELSGCSDWA